MLSISRLVVPMTWLRTKPIRSPASSCHQHVLEWYVRSVFDVEIVRSRNRRDFMRERVLVAITNRCITSSSGCASRARFRAQHSASTTHSYKKRRNEMWNMLWTRHSALPTRKCSRYTESVPLSHNAHRLEALYNCLPRWTTDRSQQHTPILRSASVNGCPM
jgi:hypothetical protein